MTKEHLTYNNKEINKDRTFQDALDYLAYNSKENEIRLLIKMCEFVLILRKALSPKNLKKQIEEGQYNGKRENNSKN